MVSNMLQVRSTRFSMMMLYGELPARSLTLSYATRSGRLTARDMSAQVSLFFEIWLDVVAKSGEFLIRQSVPARRGARIKCISGNSI